jgi:hypothetical protein
MHGQNQDFRFRGELVNLPRGFDAVQKRHGDVKNGDVRLELASLLDGFAPIPGFRTHFPSAPGLQKGAESSAHDLVIIRD